MARTTYKTRKDGAQGRAETLRRREVRRIKYQPYSGVQ